ncbi:MAG: hypothetical protein WKF43_07730 [Acidimicrobiales bacterium]
MAWIVGADRQRLFLSERITPGRLAGTPDRLEAVPVGTVHAVDSASGVAACWAQPKHFFPDMAWPPVEMAFASWCDDCMRGTGHR